jgi:hypothetical protein
VGSGSGLEGGPDPDDADPDGPDPDDPEPADADPPRFAVTAGCVAAGMLARPPGERPGPAEPCGPDGITAAAAGGPAGGGLNRTVTVTKSA